jgi:RNA-binding protein 26
MDKTPGRGGSFRGRGRGRGGRGGFTRTNAAHQKNTTLVVENIPPEFCAIDKVNEFFRKFGMIVNIQVDFAYSKALVQFNSHVEASKAYNSPEPIFDNRFVKVYWQKADKDEQPQEKQKHEQQHSQKHTEAGAPKPGPHSLSLSTAKSDVAQGRAADPQAQAVAEKKKESLKAMLELHKQKEQLIQRQIEEQKKLMELAKSNNFDEKTREEVSKRLQKVSEEIKQSKSTTLMKPFLTAGHGISQRALMEQKERERLDRELDMLTKLNVNDASLEGETIIKDVDITSETAKSEVLRRFLHR